MAFKPQLGDVISYAYLWADEHEKGHEEGLKDRPCAVVVAAQAADETLHIQVLPITHTPPHDPKDAIEIPPDIKRALKLDSERSWIVIAEANAFEWPGPDIRKTPDGGDRYGTLPNGFLRKTINDAIALDAARQHRTVKRTDITPDRDRDYDDRGY